MVGVIYNGRPKNTFCISNPSVSRIARLRFWFRSAGCHCTATARTPKKGLFARNGRCIDRYLSSCGDVYSMACVHPLVISSRLMRHLNHAPREPFHLLPLRAIQNTSLQRLLEPKRRNRHRACQRGAASSYQITAHIFEAVYRTSVGYVEA